MNSCPFDVRPRVHSLAIDELDGTASLDIALPVAPRFGLKKEEAQVIVAEVGAPVAAWRAAAKALKLKPNEIQRMVPAFDHEDLKRASAARWPVRQPPKPKNAAGKKRAKATA
jgi:serine/threonine-protein kinase HipA